MENKWRNIISDARNLVKDLYLAVHDSYIARYPNKVRVLLAIIQKITKGFVNWYSRQHNRNVQTLIRNHNVLVKHLEKYVGDTNGKYSISVDSSTKAEIDTLINAIRNSLDLIDKLLKEANSKDKGKGKGGSGGPGSGLDTNSDVKSLGHDNKVKVMDPMFDHKGNKVNIVEGMYDLRDYDTEELHDMVELKILNESHRGENKVLFPVGWKLVHTDAYNKKTKPSWWIGTVYEKPIVLFKITAVVVLFFGIPYTALTLMENIPDEWRIEAKNKQSSSGG